MDRLIKAEVTGLAVGLGVTRKCVGALMVPTELHWVARALRKLREDLYWGVEPPLRRAKVRGLRVQSRLQ